MQHVARASALSILVLTAGLAAPLAAADPPFVIAYITTPADDASVVVNEVVSFVSGAFTQSCQITAYSWDFGDGATATTRDAEHAYASTGTFSVEHEVTGNCGHRHTVIQTLNVVLPPPTAALSVTVDAALVTLDASSSVSTSGTIIAYRFTLDGQAAPEQSGGILDLTVAQHGDHVASVVVLDDAGGQSSPASVAFSTIARLVRIELNGPATLAAGTSATFLTFGFDDLDDAMPLAVESVEHAAATTAGPDVVTYEEQGVIGSFDIAVVAGGLATITLDGPTTVEVATSAAYAATGADTYGNPIALVEPIVIFNAPSIAGDARVCTSEQGIEGCRDVLVVAGPLVRIIVTGPLRLGVDETATFDVAGIDAYGNAVALSVASLSWTAPSTVGPATVCYTEASIEGCADVDVVLVRVAHVALVPSATRINIGRPLQLTFVAYDADDNIVNAGSPRCTADRGALDALLVFRGDAAGTATITCSIQGIEGVSVIRVVQELDVTLVIDAMDGATLLEPANATITAHFLDGGAVEGRNAVVTFSRYVAGSVVQLQRVTVTLDAEGQAILPVPVFARLPGDHRADLLVHTGGNFGLDVDDYTVGLGQ